MHYFVQYLCEFCVFIFNKMQCFYHQIIEINWCLTHKSASESLTYEVQSQLGCRLCREHQVLEQMCFCVSFPLSIVCLLCVFIYNMYSLVNMMTINPPTHSSLYSELKDPHSSVNKSSSLIYSFITIFVYLFLMTTLTIVLNSVFYSNI